LGFKDGGESSEKRRPYREHPLGGVLPVRCVGGGSRRKFTREEKPLTSAAKKGNIK